MLNILLCSLWPKIMYKKKSMTHWQKHKQGIMALPWEALSKMIFWMFRIVNVILLYDTLIWKLQWAVVELSLSFTKPYPLSFDMYYLGPITTQRHFPQCLYPMVWDKANKLCFFGAGSHEVPSPKSLEANSCNLSWVLAVESMEVGTYHFTQDPKFQVWHGYTYMTTLLGDETWNLC